MPLPYIERHASAPYTSGAFAWCGYSFPEGCWGVRKNTRNQAYGFVDDCSTSVCTPPKK